MLSTHTSRQSAGIKQAGDEGIGGALVPAGMVILSTGCQAVAGHRWVMSSTTSVFSVYAVSLRLRHQRRRVA